MLLLNLRPLVSYWKVLRVPALSTPFVDKNPFDELGLDSLKPTVFLYLSGSFDFLTNYTSSDIPRLLQ